MEENDIEKKLTRSRLSSSSSSPFTATAALRAAVDVSLEFFATRFLQPRLSRLLLVTAERRLLVIVVVLVGQQ